MDSAQGSSAPVNLRVLLVSSDETLLDECRAALSTLRDRRAVLYSSSSAREAVDVARSRQPHFVIAQLPSSADMAALSRELHEVVPNVLVASAYQPNRAGDSAADSAAIIELLRAEVRDFLRRPVSPVELATVLDRLLSPRPGRPAASSGRVVTFISNKGGVGKSTLAVNVACALARRRPGQVLLIDASLQLGICALMLGLSPPATLLDAARERDRLDEALLRGLAAPHPSGLRLLAAPLDALEASDINDEAIGRLLHVARRSFGYVIVDTFPMLDSVVMTALDASDLNFVVLQGTAPSVAGIARFLPVLEGLGFDSSRQRVVLNRNHKRFLGDLTTVDVAARLGRAVDFVVPYDRGVLTSMNTGEPRVLSANRWSRLARVVGDIVDQIEQLANDERRETPAGAQGGQMRSLQEVERRSGFDRRVRNVGRLAGDRRSGVDRRGMRMSEIEPLRVGAAR